MQSSKRTLRSHEISLNGVNILQQSGVGSTSNTASSNLPAAAGTTSSNLSAVNYTSTVTTPVIGGVGLGSDIAAGSVAVTSSNSLHSGIASTILSGGGVNLSGAQTATVGGIGGGVSGGISLTSGTVVNSGAVPLVETELDLNFSLQYPHFIKRDGNR